MAELGGGSQARQSSSRSPLRTKLGGVLPVPSVPRPPARHFSLSLTGATEQVGSKEGRAKLLVWSLKHELAHVLELWLLLLVAITTVLRDGILPAVPRVTPSKCRAWMPWCHLRMQGQTRGGGSRH